MLEVARRLPDIRFDVVGGDRDPAWMAPANVHWHGWVAEMAQAYAAATVVVRIPRHDGLGASMVEGLLNGRHVIYIHEVPFVRTVSPVTPERVVEAIGEFHDDHVAGRLRLNLAGRAYALEEFDENSRLERLLALLRAIA
jgi:glycosyltransferase involved in cell wall biosynthesis